jgi:hypothetical protein
MYSYYARRRNVTVRQKVFRALFCEPQNSELHAVVVSNTYLEHQRGKRVHKLLLDGQKRVLVEFGRSRPCAQVNELASTLCSSGATRGSAAQVIRGPAWILLAKERWFCMWRRSSNGQCLDDTSFGLSGEHIVEKVSKMENGEVAVWQRWLFREEHDYKAAREITGRRSALVGFPSAGEIQRTHRQ